ncbi:MAG: HAD family phosphatase [Patescibacteria group bacterium]|nr:HAD family phosphatase [Patescibacteria group bacterium]MDE2590734.1 HAD family phosphatase [Patescibacteria group bacterium]
MKYKALICDVDGTLVPNKREGMPSKKVIETIAKAADKIAIGIATARSYWQVSHILDVVPFSAPCIITGGAQVIDPRTRKTYVEHPLSIEDVLTVAEIGKGMGIAFTIADRDGEKPFANETLSKKPLDMYTNAISEERAEHFMRVVSHISTVTTYKTLTWTDEEDVHVTVANPKASKNDGVLEVCRILNIYPYEVIGIGEGHNDFSLLMACGLKVAMGDAVSDVKAIADFIAPTVAEDGVAKAIEKFVLSESD